VKKFLKGWGYNLTGSRKKRKKEILEALLELRKWVPWMWNNSEIELI
jgi:hypothetical protein